ncbi:MAG: ABC transporter ATP-binding protein [Caldilineaceae bacterium]
MLNTTPSPRGIHFDLQQTLGVNRLAGLWRLMSHYHSLYFGAALSTGLAAAANTATFLLIRYFVDRYLMQSERAISLWWIVGGFLLLATVQGSFTFLSRRLAAQTAEGITLRLRNYLFDHMQRLPFRYHDKTQTGELIQRATSDVDAIRRFFADQAIESGRITFLFLMNFGALLYLNVKLALLSILVVPVIIAVSLWFFRRIERSYEKYQEQEAKLSTQLQENLSGVRVVKAFARQTYEQNAFDAVNQEKYQRGKKLLMMHATYWPVTDIICAAQMLGGFALAASMAISGTITVGDYLAYVGLLMGIIWPLRNLGRLIVQMSQGMVSFGRIAEVIGEEREPMGAEGRQTPARLRGALRFENMQFVYAGHEERPVLRDISFEVRPGQKVALLGSTGSGKTSLINLLPRFYDYTGGRILLDGVELTDYPRAWLRPQIGIVEQEPFLFSLSIRDNISYGVGRKVSQAEIEDAARAAAVHDVIVSKFPEGYDTLVGERGITLSGGQKQRIALARTLLKDPRILILDDSTSSVDTETEALIRHALQRLMHGRTTFLIAHRIQSVMDADLILVMEHGRIVQRGTHAQLMAQAGRYRRIYEAQTRIEDELDQLIRSAN